MKMKTKTMESELVDRYHGHTNGRSRWNWNNEVASQLLPCTSFWLRQSFQPNKQAAKSKSKSQIPCLHLHCSLQHLIYYMHGRCFSSLLHWEAALFVFPAKLGIAFFSSSSHSHLTRYMHRGADEVMILSAFCFFCFVLFYPLSFLKEGLIRLMPLRLSLREVHHYS